MSPRTGRPKLDDPKYTKIGARFNNAEIERIKSCAEKLNITQGEVIRRGVDLLYENVILELQKTKKDT